MLLLSPLWVLVLSTFHYVAGKNDKSLIHSCRKNLEGVHSNQADNRGDCRISSSAISNARGSMLALATNPLVPSIQSYPGPSLGVDSESVITNGVADVLSPSEPVPRSRVPTSGYSSINVLSALIVSSNPDRGLPGGRQGSDGGYESSGPSRDWASEARPIAGAKPRLSLIRRADSNSTTLGEIDKTSKTPLKDALCIFLNNIDGFLGSAEDILLNKLPIGEENTYVTGLTGEYTLPVKYTIGEGAQQQMFPRGYQLLWTVRWDFDDNPRPGQLRKGLHVNAQFGKGPPVKYAFKLDPLSPQYWNKGPEELREKRTFLAIQSRLIRAAGFIVAKQEYRDGKDIAIRELAYYFRRVATGELPYEA